MSGWDYDDDCELDDTDDEFVEQEWRADRELLPSGSEVRCPRITGGVFRDQFEGPRQSAAEMAMHPGEYD